MGKTVLDEEILKDFTESIRRFRAVGLTAKQIKTALLKAWRSSGLKQYKALTKSFDEHFKEAFKRYQAMEIKTEICQSCGREVQVCIQCSICGKRVCKVCYAGTQLKGVKKPKNYCKTCAMVGD